MSENVTPYCSALLVCDHVHKDGMSNKHSMIGTFNHVFPKAIPTEAVPVGVYAALAGGRGNCELRIRLIHAKNYDDNLEPIFELKIENLRFENPLISIEMGFNLKAVFRQAGIHFLQLIANDELLLEKSIAVIFKPKVNE